MVSLLMLALAVSGVWSASLSDNKETFDLYIQEKGQYFKEQIVVDDEKDIVLIQVPPHNEVQGSNFMMDYSKGLTLRQDPEMKMCFLSEMTAHEKQRTPKQMTQAFKGASGKSATSDIRILKNEFTVGGPLSEEERVMLSSDMQQFCDGLPIMRLRPMTERVSVDKPLEEKAERKKRQIIDEESICNRQNHVVHCFHTLSCKYIMDTNCGRIDLDNQDEDGNGLCVDAQTWHEFEEDKYCVNCCSDKLQADEIYPACSNINKNNFKTYSKYLVDDDA